MTALFNGLIEINHGKYFCAAQKKRARFYIYYKKVYDELEKLVPAVESLNEIIDSFSYFFKVY